MTTPSIAREKGSDRGDYGFARARYIAFDAVLSLWRRRKSQGMKQTDIADILNRDPGWVSRQLKGPGNWTLRTMGELVEAMDGELEIVASALDEPIYPPPNYTAYSGYGTPPETREVNGVVVTGPFTSALSSANSTGVYVSGSISYQTSLPSPFATSGTTYSPTVSGTSGGSIGTISGTGGVIGGNFLFTSLVRST